jgi:endonuclease YncB( thermonuclease family)
MVYVDGVDAGLDVAKRGLAWIFERHLPQASPDVQASYLDAKAQAREAKLGLWQDNDPMPPWEFRKAKRTPVQADE